MMPFCYGFLETTLNSNFPVYALRSGVTVDAVAFILPAFAIGSIVFQLPLGMLSDRFGRRRIILCVTLAGSFFFLFGRDFHSIRFGCGHLFLYRWNGCRLYLLAWHQFYDRLIAKASSSRREFNVRDGV